MRCRLVAAVRFDQAQERLVREPACARRASESLQQWMLGSPSKTRPTSLLEHVEQRQPIAGSLVAELIDEAGESVDG